jgi:tetratricopeptide (TPR) repeat protein
LFLSVCCLHIKEFAVLRVEKTVFISYRRTNQFMAMNIYKSLTERGYDVFLDYNSIHSGDFEQNIFANIKSRAHFILILTNSALERIHEPDDLFRREIELAITSKRNIIPLTFEDFDWALASQKSLNGQLVILEKYNALRVPIDYFDAALEKLCTERLNIPLDAVLHPTTPTGQQVAVEQKREAAQVFEVLSDGCLSAEEHFEQAFDLAKKGDTDSAIAKLTLAIRAKPDYPAAFFNRGNARCDKGDLKGALADYSEAIRLNPEYSSAFNNRGTVCYELDDLDGAIADYTIVIRLRPGYASALNNRGNARRHQGDLNGAVADYSEAIKLRPDYATAYYNRGNVRRVQGHLEGAVADYSQSIRLEPADATAFNNRGNARGEQGNLDGAIADYTAAIRLKPCYAGAFYNRGAARFEKGDFSGAVADYGEALCLKPDHFLAFYNRGLARKASGDLDGALEDYGEAIRLKPDYAAAFYNRGIAHKASGDLAHAASDLQKYLDLGGGIADGDHEEVEQIIRHLDCG